MHLPLVVACWFLMRGSSVTQEKSFSIRLSKSVKHKGSVLRQEVCVPTRRQSKAGFHLARSTEPTARTSREGRQKFSSDFYIQK